MASQKEGRFSHLLQPIRDLADNWNVDIAAELEEYLQTLESIPMDVDSDVEDEEGHLNFAEAALVIQGSASIYSKKVEYLYQLLCKTLDFLHNRKQKASKENPNAPADDEGPHEPEFLTLDDIEEAANIDLVEDEEPEEDEQQEKQKTSRGRKKKSIAQTDYSSGALSLFIAQQTGSALTMEPREGDDERRSDFRLNTCSLHPSGALLFEDRDRLQMDEYLERVGSKRSARTSTSDSDERMMPPPKGNNSNDWGMGGMDDSSDDEAPERLPPFKPGEATTLGDKSSDEDSEKKQAGELDKEKQLEKQGESSAQNKTDEKLAQEPSKSRKKVNEKKRQQQPIAETVNKDFWKALDPHDGSSVKRPFKAGRKFQNCKISTQTAEELGRASFNLLFPSASRALQKDTRDDGHSSRSSSLKSYISPEFHYLYQLRLKQKMAERRKSKTRGSTGGEEVLDEEDVEDGVDVAPMHDDDDDDMQINGEETETVTVRQGGMRMSSDVNEMDSDMDNDGPAPFGDFDSGSADITGGLIVGHGDWSDVPIHTDEASYEEMVRQHVEKYLSSVEGFIRETTLTQRIGDWRKKIFPVLEEQESRPSYDIKIYGRTLLDRCNKEKATKTKSVALQRLVQDVGGEAPAHEVCRYFLALLQLSNDGNIQIVPDKEGSLKRLDVKLINDRQRADVEAYRGPPSTAEDKMMQLSDKENMENMS